MVLISGNDKSVPAHLVAIVSDQVLHQALREGWIAGAGLDDIEEEPAKQRDWTPAHPLFSLDNVIITPHAAYSEEAIHTVRDFTASEVVRVLTGQPPLSPVNAAQIANTRRAAGPRLPVGTDRQGDGAPVAVSAMPWERSALGPDGYEQPEPGGPVTGDSPYRVVVIGAGFAGIGMGVALQQAGIDDFLIVDKAADLGGTWRDNTYPGLCCDVPCNLYSFSFRPWRWSRRFPPRQEILAYLQAVAAEHELGPHLRLGCEVTAARFDDGSATWNLTLADGRTLRAAALVSAVGQLSRPSFPDIPGRDDFGGPSWHSARWDHGVDLTRKRVAVIGTGASAIQFVPEIVRQTAHVDVYQRSAPYVLPKSDRPYHPAEQALFETIPAIRKADRLRTFLYGELLTSGFVLSPKLLAAPRLLWLRQLRAISDPELRARCVPDYVMGCKRVVFSNAWYPTLARPDVTLVTDRIDRIVPDGVVAADTLRPADAIIYGTGFQTTEFLAPMSVTGLGGRRLDEAWRDGAEAYLGITVAGFPNFFLLYGPNTNLGGNSIIYMLEGQIRYVAGALRALREQRLKWLTVRPEVQAEFNAWVRSASATSVWETGCHNWYTTASGRNTSNWPVHTFMYRYRVRHFDLSQYTVMPEHTPAPQPVAGAG